MALGAPGRAGSSDVLPSSLASKEHPQRPPLNFLGETVSQNCWPSAAGTNEGRCQDGTAQLLGSSWGAVLQNVRLLLLKKLWAVVGGSDSMGEIWVFEWMRPAEIFGLRVNAGKTSALGDVG